MTEFGKGRPTGLPLLDSAKNHLTPYHGWLRAVGIAGAALIVLFLDFRFSPHIAMPILYGLVILMAWWIPVSQATLWTASLCSLLIAVGTLNVSMVAEKEAETFHRVLSLILVWSIALFLWKRKNAEQALQAALREHHTKLEQSQDDLRANILHRKQTERELEDLNRTLLEKNQELETIVSVASHDLRSPLVNIQGFSRELAHSRLHLQAKLESHKLAPGFKQEVMAILEGDIPESLHYIQTGAKKMETLLQGLLRFSRLGRLTLKFEELNMNAMIAGIIVGMEYQLKEKGIALQIEDLPTCTGDATLINQLFFNLIDNAHKYIGTRRPGMIRITGIRENGFAKFGVEDNGIGIRHDHQEKIFHMFHRLNPSSGSGQGLGLTIVRRIVERHKGQITLDSHPDRGTTFTVFLPVSLNQPPL